VPVHNDGSRRTRRVGPQPDPAAAGRPGGLGCVQEAAPTAGQLPIEGRVVLKVTTAAALTGEPAALPRQGDPPARHRQIADLPDTGVVHGPGLEPTVGTAGPRPGGGRLHHKLLDRVDEHPQDADQSQVQPHPHSVRSHRGVPWIDIGQDRFQWGPGPRRWTPYTPLTPPSRAASAFGVPPTSCTVGSLTRLLNIWA